MVPCLCNSRETMDDIPEATFRNYSGLKVEKDSSSDLSPSISAEQQLLPGLPVFEAQSQRSRDLKSYATDQVAPWLWNSPLWGQSGTQFGVVLFLTHIPH